VGSEDDGTVVVMTTVEYIQTRETVLPRELAYGVFRVADAPSTSHQRVVRQIACPMHTFVQNRALGEVLFAPIDVVLDYRANLVVQPDIVFVARERQRIAAHRLYGVPDLVVDVLSPHPRIGNLDERVNWYAKYGVREIWLATVNTRQLLIVTPFGGRTSSQQLHTGLSEVQSAVLPGFNLRPVDVFE
jgi:Uma2 family endonuclease